MSKKDSAAAEGAQVSETKFADMDEIHYSRPAETSHVDDAANLSDKEVVALSKALLKKDAKIADLEQRLSRLEKRLKPNERFARTFATCMDTQVIAIDSVTRVFRRALKTDAETAAELSAAIHEYDRHKFRRWLSGFGGVFLWVGSVCAAAFIGAFIYWIFSAN